METKMECQVILVHTLQWICIPFWAGSEIYLIKTIQCLYELLCNRIYILLHFASEHNTGRLPITPAGAVQHYNIPQN